MQLFNAQRPVRLQTGQRGRNHTLRRLVPAVSGPSFESIDNDDLTAPVLTLVSCFEPGLSSSALVRLSDVTFWPDLSLSDCSCPSAIPPVVLLLVYEQLGVLRAAREVLLHLDINSVTTQRHCPGGSDRLELIIQP